MALNPCIYFAHRTPSSLSLWSAVWEANVPHLPLHLGAEGAGVPAAQEASAAQDEYTVLPVSKIALAALEGCKIRYESLKICLLAPIASFRRGKSVWMLLETWQDCIHH